MLLRLSGGLRLGRRLFMKDRVAGRLGGGIVRFGRGEFFLKHQRGGRIEAWRGRLGRTLSVSSPEPVSLAARTSRSTVTLFSAARTSPVEGVSLAARRNEIAADFGDDSQAVVRRLRRVLQEIVSEWALSAATTATATTTANLAVFQRRTAAALAQAPNLFILIARRFESFLILRLDRRRAPR